MEILKTNAINYSWVNRKLNHAVSTDGNENKEKENFTCQEMWGVAEATGSFYAFKCM